MRPDQIGNDPMSVPACRPAEVLNKSDQHDRIVDGQSRLPRRAPRGYCSPRPFGQSPVLPPSRLATFNSTNPFCPFVCLCTKCYWVVLPRQPPRPSSLLGAADRAFLAPTALPSNSRIPPVIRRSFHRHGQTRVTPGRSRLLGAYASRSRI